MCSVLALEAEVDAAFGRFGRSGDDVREILRCGNLLGRQPGLISLICKVNCDRRAFGAVRRCEKDSSDPSELSALREAIVGDYKPPDLSAAIRGEAYTALASARNGVLFDRAQGDSRRIDSRLLRRSGLPPGDSERADLLSVVKLFADIWPEISARKEDFQAAERAIRSAAPVRASGRQERRSLAAVFANTALLPTLADIASYAEDHSRRVQELRRSAAKGR